MRCAGEAENETPSWFYPISLMSVGGSLHLVVLSGAGISAESGLRTFRDGDGLWEEHQVGDVATPEAWSRDPELVLRFYDQRRAQAARAEPNAAHRALAAFENECRVSVITQNVDDLHERAGSTQVLHLHGELRKVRSSIDESMVMDWGNGPLRLGQLCPLGSQLRPHVVWFGEAVPAIADAAAVLADADALLVVGTSLNVYPAASLVHAAPPATPVWLVDPRAPALRHERLRVLAENAGDGVPRALAEIRARCR